MEQTYRGYRIVPLGTFSLLKIQAPGSGTVPAALNGLFTSKAQAEMAIDRSMNSLKKRGRKKNGTEESTSSD